MVKSAAGIRFVYFDLDDTLVDTTTAVEAAYAAARAAIAPDLATRGLRAPAAAVEEDLLSIFGSRLPREYFIAWLAEAGGTDGLARDLAARAAAAYRTRLGAIPPFPATAAVLTELAARGIGRGVITDGIRDEQRRKLKDAGLADLVGPVFISEDYPMFENKPGQRMFEDALAAAGFPAAEVAFVGDRVKDVIGANLAGMVSVRVWQGWATRERTAAGLRVAQADVDLRTLAELPEALAAFAADV
jgi:putative hydrolase of the HAD superfamily